MIGIFYGCILAGALLLVADLRGNLRVSPERLAWWRGIGLVAAAGPGLAPVLAWATGALSVTWPFPLIAIADLVAFLVLAVGVFGWTGDRGSVRVRRLGYLGLLVVGTLPSWVLLLLAPAVGLAGLALARPRDAPRSSA